jgi:hypothetical protein
VLAINVDFALKRFALSLVAIVFVASLALPDSVTMAGPASSTVSVVSRKTQSRAWSGILVSSSCNADEAFNESPECNKDVPGAKLALYDDTNRVMYGLEPQSSISARLGDTVTVRGALDGDTIQITSVALMSIGLAVGQKAPPFAARDQLGRVQNLDTLKGRNGTVLLFFRSADW